MIEPLKKQLVNKSCIIILSHNFQIYSNIDNLIFLDYGVECTNSAISLEILDETSKVKFRFQSRLDLNTHII